MQVAEDLDESVVDMDLVTSSLSDELLGFVLHDVLGLVVALPLRKEMEQRLVVLLVDGGFDMIGHPVSFYSSLGGSFIWSPSGR